MQAQNTTVRWEWDSSEDGDIPRWLSFDAETIAIIEAAHASGNGSVPLSHGFFGEQGGYSINFLDMTQTKNSSGYVRQIQRVEGKEGEAAPKPVQTFWEWENSGKWVRYDSETNLLLSETYEKKQIRLELNHGYFGSMGGYSVDFSKMVQIRDSTGNHRQIRRNPPARRLPGPAPEVGRYAAAKPVAKEPRLETVRCDPALASSLRNALALFGRRERDLPQEAPAEDIIVD